MNPALARLLSRYPRGMGALLGLLCSWAFESSAVGDHWARLAALASGATKVLVTKIAYLQIFVAGAALGLWMLIAGIPIDDETGRPPDWWYLGLAFFVIAAIALREQLGALMVLLFA
jgi:hypothetical protein